MKLKTILAVAATSIGLLAHAEYADKVVSFEGMTADQAATKTTLEADEAVYSSDATWDLKDNTDITVKAYEQGDAKFATRASQFTALDIPYNKYLAIKTPLTNGIVRTASTTIDGEIFVDTLVKFTAVDKEDTVDVPNDAKIAVWVQAQDDEGTVNNIKVTAGANKTVYDCGAIANLDQWHRLTIKVIGDVTNGNGANGVVIYLDGASTPLSCADAQSAFAGKTLTNVAAEYKKNGQLFPAITDGPSFTSVEFAGQGAIDDVVFTETAEDFAKDPTVAELTFGTTIAKLYVNDGEETLTFEGSPAKFVYDGTKTYKYWYDADSGYISLPEKDAKTLTSFDIEIDPATKAVAQIGDNNYATVAAAIGEVTEGQTVTLLANAKDIVVEKTGVAFTLDINGYEVAAENAHAITVSAGALTITDGATGGKVVGLTTAGDEPTVYNAVYANGGAVTINGGIFDGKVAATKKAGSSILINDGSFKVADNEKDALDKYAKEGYAFKEQSGYFVLAVKPIFEGAGTADDPYQIATAAHLVKLAELSVGDDKANWLDKCYKQMGEITLTETFAGIGAPNAKDNIKKPDEGGSQGFIDGAFQGTYDGQGYAIKGLVIGLTGKIDYIGLFNSCYDATIKNLKVGLGNATGWSSDTDSGDQVGAVIAGVTGKTTIENVETIVVGDNNTFKSAKKTAAGIVGYAAGGTVLSNCVNNLNIVAANEKSAGLIACAQDTGAFGGGITVWDCANNGNVECTTSGKTRASLLVSYTDAAVTFKGTITARGTVTQKDSTANIQSIININSGSATVVDGAVITAPAGMKSTIHNGKDHAGLNYATVDGDVATFVADSEAKNGANLKVMTTGNTITLANVGDKITLDTTLATATVTTTATDAYVDQEGNVYTVKEKTTPEIEITLAKTEAEWETGLAFPTATVKVDGQTSALTGTWSPDTIEEPTGAGVTNVYTYKVTVPATDKTLEATETATFKVYKSAAPVVPVPVDGDLDKKGEENATAVAEAITAAGGDVNTWVETVYGKDGKIPAEKLNATTPEIVALAVANDLPITKNVPTFAVEAAEAEDGVAAFTFKLMDGATPEQINALTAKVKAMVKYTGDLDVAFDAATEDEVSVELDEGAIKAELKKQDDVNAGFMKVEPNQPE